MGRPIGPNSVHVHLHNSNAHVPMGPMGLAITFNFEISR